MSPLLGGGERVYATYAALIRDIGESFQRKIEGEQPCILGVRGAKRGVAAARLLVTKVAGTPPVLIDRLDLKT